MKTSIFTQNGIFASRKTVAPVSSQKTQRKHEFR